MKRLVVLALIGVTLLGCKKNNNSCGQAYFGGEIINPSNNHIILHDDSSVIDTLYLDKNNRFSYNIETLSPGLHSFVHGGEYQIVVLEPNDSVLIRLNTIDFDESLVFTGVGSKKNNFLINLFNELEAEEKKMYQISKLEPNEFITEIDSFSKIKKSDLDSFMERQECSELFSKVANRTIDYFYNTQKELYPFRYFGRQKLVNFKDLPSDFYNYRSSLDYDDDDLKDFFPYYKFMWTHIDNLALEEYFNSSGDTIFNRNAIKYNLNKLDIINNLVNNNSIKNNLLKYSTRNYLSYANTIEDCESMYNSFIEKTTDKEHKDYITGLLNSLKKLQPGNRFPEIEVVDFKNNVANINTKINKPTVIYFWTKAIRNHFKNSHTRVLELKEKYPEIDFISVNINSSTKSTWKKMLIQNRFPVENEYKFRDPEAAKKILAIHYINKVFIVDKNNLIVDSNANLFRRDFDSVLDELIK